MQERNNMDYEIDLLELAIALKNKIVPILICGLAGLIISGAVTMFAITPQYSSTSKLYVLTQSTSITSLADIQMGSSLAADYVELIQSRPLVEKVASDLNLDYTYKQMLEKMSVENKANTRMLSITVTDPDPVIAQEIANKFAEVAKKRISDIMETSEPNIVEEGIVNEDPVSPSKPKNMAMGLLLGLFAAAGVVIVRHLLDDTVKTADDVKKYLELDTIASIPYIDNFDVDGDGKKRPVNRVLFKKLKQSGKGVK